MNRFERHPDELLSASVSGDLTAAERRELNEHLAVCADCRATLDAYTTQRQLLSGMRQVQPPRDLAPRVRAGIESGRFGAPWWRRPGGIFAAAASLATVGAAAVLAVILVGNLRTGPVASSSSPATSPSAATASESTAATPTPEAPAAGRNGLPVAVGHARQLDAHPAAGRRGAAHAARALGCSGSRRPLPRWSLARLGQSRWAQGDRRDLGDEPGWRHDGPAR
jgi:anti-sigma factor RsiW